MSWTDPRTWVAGELLTASLLNTHVRDNLIESRTIRGRVAADGTIVDGEGFLVTKLGTGEYQIDLDDDMDTTVCAVAVPQESGGVGINVKSVAPLVSRFKVWTFVPSDGIFFDFPFMFSASNATDLA